MDFAEDAVAVANMMVRNRPTQPIAHVMVEDECDDSSSVHPSASITELDEGAIDAVITAVCKRDRYREMLYRTLGYCRQSRTQAEVEETIAAMPESQHALQDPPVFVDMLVACGGLSSRPLGEDGEPIPDETWEAMDDDARADATFGHLLATNAAGVAALSILAPDARIRAKLSEKPERYSTYLAVLDYCREPRSLADVQRLFDGNPQLVRKTNVDSQKLSPDYYLSELERAGGLVWDGGWTTTDAGRSFLAAACMEA